MFMKIAKVGWKIIYFCALVRCELNDKARELRKEGAGEGEELF